MKGAPKLKRGDMPQAVKDAVAQKRLDGAILQRAPLHVAVTCKSCLFHKKKATFAGTPCNDLGIQGTSDPCPRFLPDLALGSKSTGRAVAALRELGELDGMSTTLLLALLAGGAKANKHGFKFGEPVFVKSIETNAVVVGADSTHLTMLTDTGAVLRFPPSAVRKA